MVRSFLPDQPVCDRRLEISLYDLLQDSLAIKKECLVLQIIQNKTMDKLFRISKTTIHVYSSNQRLQRIRSDRIPFSPPGSIFTLP